MQNKLNELIALFLAEILRSRKTSIRRAAEIARRVVEELPGVATEAGALNMLANIERDFEEVVILKQALHFGFSDADVRVYEREVKEHASHMFERDVVATTEFLQDAASPNMSIQRLCVKYPEFCAYLHHQHIELPVATPAA